MDCDGLAAIIADAREQRATTLDLSRRGLTKLPPEIGNLTSLTDLELMGNGLSAVPPALGNLTGLTRLDLTNNQLTALPPQ